MSFISISFSKMLYFIKKDKMLLVSCLAPLLAGSFFKFIIPIIDLKVIELSSLSIFLSPYYGIFDLFFTLLTPILFCFVSSMVILEETDENISKYLFITPLTRKGYLISRIGIPTIIALGINVVLLPFFKLTDLSIYEIISFSIVGALQGLISSLLIVTLSTNKLEGMAITKLTSIALVFIMVPFFIESKVAYILSPFPSFWIGKAFCAKNLIYIFVAFILSLIWIYILMKRYLKKIL